MATKADFTPEEWQLLKRTLHEPGAAVMLAAPGGMLRELLAVAKGLAEAGGAFAESDLVQSLLRDGDSSRATATEEKTAPGRAGRPNDFMDVMIGNLRQALKIVQAKATPKELEDYRQLVLLLAERIAGAAKEGSADQAVTESEQRVLDEIRLVLHRRA